MADTEPMRRQIAVGRAQILVGREERWTVAPASDTRGTISVRRTPKRSSDGLRSRAPIGTSFVRSRRRFAATVGSQALRVSPRDNFVVLRAIGDADAEVFEARARQRRNVVLRFWRPRSDLEAAEIITRVNRALRLQHPMLAHTYGAQRFDDGTLCLVSEYVRGGTLDAAVSVAGVPQLRIAVDFVRRLALGLSAAHRRGLSHHALHPGNIVVLTSETKQSGRIVAKLLDLAVPRIMRPTPRLEAAHFIAPEALGAELRGEPARAPDARMNVYSCGCLLHYLCTGEPPFRSDSLEALSALHASGARAAPRRLNPAIPPSLERVIVQALERDPSARTASAASLAAALWRSSNSVLHAAGATPAKLHSTRDRKLVREAQAPIMYRKFEL
jgi:serine/threonine-protein kinase